MSNIELPSNIVLSIEEDFFVAKCTYLGTEYTSSADTMFGALEELALFMRENFEEGFERDNDQNDDLDGDIYDDEELDDEDF